jgi:hypothetical protein
MDDVESSFKSDGRSTNASPKPQSVLESCGRCVECLSIDSRLYVQSSERHKLTLKNGKHTHTNDLGVVNILQSRNPYTPVLREDVSGS